MIYFFSKLITKFIEIPQKVIIHSQINELVSIHAGIYAKPNTRPFLQINIEIKKLREDADNLMQGGGIINVGLLKILAGFIFQIQSGWIIAGYCF